MKLSAVIAIAFIAVVASLSMVDAEPILNRRDPQPLEPLAAFRTFRNDIENGRVARNNRREALEDLLSERLGFGDASRHRNAVLLHFYRELLRRAKNEPESEELITTIKFIEEIARRHPAFELRSHEETEKLKLAFFEDCEYRETNKKEDRLDYETTYNEANKEFEEAKSRIKEAERVVEEFRLQC
jgi:hypothetical protein